MLVRSEMVVELWYLVCTIAAQYAGVGMAHLLGFRALHDTTSPRSFLTILFTFVAFLAGTFDCDGDELRCCSSGEPTCVTSAVFCTRKSVTLKSSWLDSRPQMGTLTSRRRTSYDFAHRFEGGCTNLRTRRNTLCYQDFESRW